MSAWRVANPKAGALQVKFEQDDDCFLLPEPPKAEASESVPLTVAAPKYKKYASVDEIDYVPEDALKQGLGMIGSLKDFLKKLDIGSKLRQEVWMRDITK